MAVKDRPATDRPQRTAPSATSYGSDVYRWAEEQAAHLRSGRFDLIDLANAADEIADVGRREYDALVSNLEIILTHMLKWDVQPQRRSRSWQNSILEHRDRVEYRFAHSPSLRARRTDIVADAYRFACRRAARETRMRLEQFPSICPYEWDDIMRREFSIGSSDGNN